MRTDTVALLGLGAAGLWYLSRQPAFASLRAPDGAGGLFLPPSDVDDLLPAPGGSPGRSRTGQILGAGATVGTAVIGAWTGGAAAGGTGAGAGAGAGAAGGISTAAALTAAGVAAGAAIVAWGVIRRGWFRGGEEALKVNPARDAWFQYWIDHYYPGQGSARQFDAYVHAHVDAGVPGDVARQLLDAVYRADTVREFEAATANVTRTFEYYAGVRRAA